MTRASTAIDSVPASPPPARRRRRGAVALLAVLVGLVAGSSVQVPYYAIAPGSVVRVAPLVDVGDAPSFAAEGLFFPTVSLGRTTVLEALEGWLDPSIDVVEERVVLPPDVDAEELRDFNLGLMATSKDKALAVAFEELGFDAVRGDGATVVQVVPGTAADGVLQEGDVVVAVDGQPVELDAEAVAAVGAHQPGEQVTLTVRRDGELREVAVELGEHPERPGRPLLGVSLQTAEARFEFPYQLDIESERIGGPSAGLAFTLYVLDVLTEGRLTGGLQVAATGTIELDGSVGEIGGVPQKAIAVAEAGIDVFLVPAGEADAARAHAPEGLRIEGVATLDEALAVLARLGGDPLNPPPGGTDA